MSERDGSGDRGTAWILPLGSDRLGEAVALDRQALGGLWDLDGYARELDSPNSDLLGLFLQPGSPPPGDALPGEGACLAGLGCQWAIVDEAHITLVAIAPDCQRQGFGRAMVWTLLALARDRCLVRATLEVRAGNAAARALYDEFGFREAGIRKHYYPATGEDAAVLWRSGLDRREFVDDLRRWRAIARERLARGGWRWPPAATPTFHEMR